MITKLNPHTKVVKRMNNKFVLARKRYAITIVLILVFSMSGCNTKDVQSQLENSRNNYLKTNETGHLSCLSSGRVFR